MTPPVHLQVNSPCPVAFSYGGRCVEVPIRSQLQYEIDRNEGLRRDRDRYREALEQLTEAITDARVSGLVDEAWTAARAMLDVERTDR